MTVETFFWLVVVYLLLGLLHTGFAYADYEEMVDGLDSSNYRSDLGFAAIVGFASALLFFLGTVLVLGLTGFGRHGWRLWPRKGRRQ